MLPRTDFLDALMLDILYRRQLHFASILSVYHAHSVNVEPLSLSHVAGRLCCKLFHLPMIPSSPEKYTLSTQRQMYVIILVESCEMVHENDPTEVDPAEAVRLLLGSGT